MRRIIAADRRTGNATLRVLIAKCRGKWQLRRIDFSDIAKLLHSADAGLEARVRARSCAVSRETCAEVNEAEEELRRRVSSERQAVEWVTLSRAVERVCAAYKLCAIVALCNISFACTETAVRLLLPSADTWLEAL